MRNMYAIGAVCCAGSLLGPLHEQPPRALSGGMTIAFGVLTLWLSRAPTVSDRVLHLLLGSGLLATTAFIAVAATPQGAAIASLAYTWGTIYAAYFLTRRATRCCIAASAGGFGLGVLLNPFPSAFLAWLFITATTAFAGERLCLLLEELRSAARTDPLTGTLNRLGLEQVARRHVAEAHHTGSPLAVVVIDLDDFKQVNDRRGHAAGDALLVSLTEQWQQALRGGDVLARSGGDAFVLLLPGTAQTEAAEVLGRLTRGPNSRWSCGVAVLEPGEDYATCLARADRELYRAKAERARPATMVVAPRSAEATDELSPRAVPG